MNPLALDWKPLLISNIIAGLIKPLQVLEFVRSAEGLIHTACRMVRRNVAPSWAVKHPRFLTPHIAALFLFLKERCGYNSIKLLSARHQQTSVVPSLLGQ